MPKVTFQGKTYQQSLAAIWESPDQIRHMQYKKFCRHLVRKGEQREFLRYLLNTSTPFKFRDVLMSFVRISCDFEALSKSPHKDFLSIEFMHNLSPQHEFIPEHTHICKVTANDILLIGDERASIKPQLIIKSYLLDGKSRSMSARDTDTLNRTTHESILPTQEEFRVSKRAGQGQGLKSKTIPTGIIRIKSKAGQTKIYKSNNPYYYQNIFLNPKLAPTLFASLAIGSID